jgi:hypothetical protein
VIEVTDEMLMAYADGELDPSTRAQVEIALNQDRRARERVKIFLATGTRLSHLFDLAMRQPVPARILACVPASTTSRSAPAARRPALLRLLEETKSIIVGPRWAAALALSVAALLIGGGLYGIAHRPGDEPHQFVTIGQDRIFARGPLERALEATPSGSKVVLNSAPSDATLMAVLTFRNLRQEYCRQYEITTPDSGRAGLACRDTDGRWRLEIDVPVAELPAPSDRIVPAGKFNSAVEAAISKAMQGDALGPADEEAVIRNHWRR